MACGAPVAAGKGHAVEEVTGDAALLFDPLSVDEITRCIDRTLADAELSKDLASRALVRAAEFSWENTAKEVVRIFEETAGSPSPAR